MGVTNQIKNRGHGQCRRRLQSKITEYDANCDECNYPNIEPQGDTIAPREDGDNKYRQVWHNVYGSRHTGVMSSGELEAIHDIGANIAGYTETNKPWTLGSKNEYDLSMRNMVGPHRTQHASAPAEFDCKYQNGGCLLSVNGELTGSIMEMGSDRMGRFCWTTLKGKRDEGRLVVSGYRVPQKTRDAAGPDSQYM